MENRKSTGIVRRIDDLGRLVIPKEIRRRLHICEGDLMEIFVTEDTVSFQKYSVLGDLTKCGDVLRGLYHIFKCPVLLCDRDQVIDACGIKKEHYENKPFSETFSVWINSQYRSVMNDAKLMEVFKDSEWNAEVTQTIQTGGDFYGAIVVLAEKSSQPSDIPDEIRQTCIKLAAGIIESMIEAD